MTDIKTRFPQLAMKKLGVSSVEEVDRMKIVREADISYPTVVRWLEGSIDRFDGDTVKKLCLWLGVDIGDLLMLGDKEE